MKGNCNEFFMTAYRDRVYSEKVTIMSLYGSLRGQGLWCEGNCKEFVWQLTFTGFMVKG